MQLNSTLRPGLTFEVWSAYGELLVRVEHSIMWALGEWWLYGQREYGEAAAQALPTGYALKKIQTACAKQPVL
jgi:hypothetical protein